MTALISQTIPSKNIYSLTKPHLYSSDGYEWTKNSDIDILAVVADKEDDIIDILNKAKTDASPLLEIRPISTTVKKFTEGLRVKAEFYDNLWKDRIILYNEFLFWQLIKEGGK